MSKQLKPWMVALVFVLPCWLVTSTAVAQEPLEIAPSLAGPRPIRIPGIPKEAQWVNPPSAFHISGHGLEIVASPQTNKYIAADMSMVSDNANRLVFDADPNFILSTQIDHPFAKMWDAGCLILEGDTENWIKFCFEGDYTGAKRIVSVVTRGTSDDSNSIALDKNAAYLEMAKIGDVVFLYSSATGRDWFMVRVLKFQFDGNLRLGFLAQTPEGDSNRVHFGHIKYSPTVMKDYWKGE
jgi:regulation of enolase protein 1 (concanavalin A-like superfamily)